MIIQAFPSGPLSTNAYIIACPHTKIAAIIDPAPESANKINSFITTNNLTVKYILLTHSHWDHIADVATLKAKYNTPVYIHAEDVANLQNPGSDGLPCWLDIPSVHPDVFFKEGDRIPLGNLNFTVIETPGHTPGGICLYCLEYNVLISGDTLFQGSIGNISFSTGRPALMWQSLKKLALLPPETIVFPGHGPKTTIRQESWLGHAETIFGD